MSYEQFFHLKDSPFRLTPDPAYFFPSGVHKEALDTMVYSIKAGEGFVMITGTPGVGKTLLVRTLLRELGDTVNLALVLNPTLSPRELLWVILDDLGHFNMEQSEKLPKEKLLRHFKDYLMEKSQLGVKTIVIIDEAQNLPKETLEELRMLSNLETDRQKLLQIILVGQLELEERLKYDELKQLAQRISVRYRITPLTREETGAYVRHRLEVAGDARSVRFMPRILSRIHDLSSGIPRRINLICERALMAAYVDDESQVSRKHIMRAIRSIEGEDDKFRTIPVWVWPVAACAVLLVATVWFALQYKPQPPSFVKVEKSVSQTAHRTPGTDLKSVPIKPTAVPAPIDNSNIQVNARVIDEKPVQPAPQVQEGGTDLKSVPMKQDLVAQTADPSPSVLHLAPSLLPIDEYFLAVDRDANIAQLWQGTESGSLLRHQFKLDWRIMEGLYILGSDKQKGAFIFNPTLFQWGGYKLLNASALWAQVSGFVQDSLIPVVVFSGNNLNGDLLTEESATIQKAVDTWSDAWRNRDIRDLMGFYGKTFTSYSIDSETGQTYTRHELSEIRGRILATSSYITLLTSRPVCIIDPQNPDLAMAVFKQEYMSNTYTDQGTKVLYLRREGSDSEQPWKIVAKFFLPKE